ncbi:hypothetical protein FRB96_001790 [Tulasnella sp. 330]|nr:hypothetical protein FRB96_001790 [Tulasnella sp. 330]
MLPVSPGLDHIFASSRLELVVPDGSFELPESFSTTGAEWLDNIVQSLPTREMAFFDERLHFMLTVTIPRASFSSAGDTDAKSDTQSEAPPAALGTFLSHLQISLEASYVSPVAPFALSALTASPASASVLSPLGRPTTAPTPVKGMFPLNLGPGRKDLTDSLPNTPHPIPSTAAHDAAFAKAGEGGAVVQSYIWGEGREKDAIEAVGKAFCLLWSDEDEAWIAVYKLDVAVVWMQTRFEHPLLCLTASTTLREKRLTVTPQRAPLISLVNKFSPQSTQEEPDAVVDVAPAPMPAELELMGGLPEFNLLSGLGNGITFASESTGPLAPLPSTRLSDSTRKNAYSLRPLAPQPQVPSPRALSKIHTSPAIPTMRKSYRKILSAVSGIRVRMRTTFVPQLILSGSSELDDWEDHGSEERTVILAVEVENAGNESHRGFEVEGIKVTVGGPADGAKAILIGWGSGPNSKPLYGEEAEKVIFPMRIKSVEQYNLLYAVYFSGQAPGSAAWPSSNSLGSNGGRVPELQKPMSIVVSGRPWDPEVAKPRFGRMRGASLPPTKAFTSRWSSLLDLAATSQLAEDRPATPLSALDTMPVPPSPYPTSTEAPSTAARRPNSLKSFQSAEVSPVSPVAGSKRHTIAGLQQQRSERMSLGRKLLIANHHASSRPSSPLPPSASTLPISGMKTLTPLQITVPPGSPSYANVNIHTGLNTPHAHEHALSSTPQLPRKQKGQSAPLPPIPFQSSPRDMDIPSGSNTLLVSISLIPPSAYSLDGQHPLDLIATEREKIYQLDMFALDIFVYNKSTTRTRRCKITYPDRREHGLSMPQRFGSTRNSQGLIAITDGRDDPLGISPLENDIHIGPLQPDSCMSVRMRFMALRTGVHTIEMLTLHDLDSDTMRNLRSVMHVVVHEQEEISLAVDNAQLAEVELN